MYPITFEGSDQKPLHWTISLAHRSTCANGIRLPHEQQPSGKRSSMDLLASILLTYINSIQMRGTKKALRSCSPSWKAAITQLPKIRYTQPSGNNIGICESISVGSLLTLVARLKSSSSLSACFVFFVNVLHLLPSSFSCSTKTKQHIMCYFVNMMLREQEALELTLPFSYYQ